MEFIFKNRKYGKIHGPRYNLLNDKFCKTFKQHRNIFGCKIAIITEPAFLMLDGDRVRPADSEEET